MHLDQDLYQYLLYYITWVSCSSVYQLDLHSIYLFPLSNIKKISIFLYFHLESTVRSIFICTSCFNIESMGEVFSDGRIVSLKML